MSFSVNTNAAREQRKQAREGRKPRRSSINLQPPGSLAAANDQVFRRSLRTPLTTPAVDDPSMFLRRSFRKYRRGLDSYASQKKSATVQERKRDGKTKLPSHPSSASSAKASVLDCDSNTSSTKGLTRKSATVQERKRDGKTKLSSHPSSASSAKASVLDCDSNTSSTKGLTRSLAEMVAEDEGGATMDFESTKAMWESKTNHRYQKSLYESDDDDNISLLSDADSDASPPDKEWLERDNDYLLKEPLQTFSGVQRTASPTRDLSKMGEKKATQLNEEDRKTPARLSSSDSSKHVETVRAASESKCNSPLHDSSQESISSSEEKSNGDSHNGSGSLAEMVAEDEGGAPVDFEGTKAMWESKTNQW